MKSHEQVCMCLLKDFKQTETWKERWVFSVSDWFNWFKIWILVQRIQHQQDPVRVNSWEKSLGSSEQDYVTLEGQKTKFFCLLWTHKCKRLQSLAAPALLGPLWAEVCGEWHHWISLLTALFTICSWLSRVDKFIQSYIFFLLENVQVASGCCSMYEHMGAT